VHAVDELLKGIRTVKLASLEPVWECRIAGLRALETEALRGATFVKAMNGAISFTLPVFVILASFAGHVLVFHNVLDPTVAFASVGLFGVLSRVLNMTPYGVVAISESFPTWSRLDSFFSQIEVQRLHALPCSPVSSTGTSEPALRISIRDADFGWDAPKRTSEASTVVPALSNITLSVVAGETVCVVGPVASGKTSLLHAVLGELRCLNSRGACATSGRVAYCAQQNWILNATVRDNIVVFGAGGAGAGFGFGGTAAVVDEKRYQETLRACCLLRDLEQLPASDMTEIGEKGVTLSGGQQSRIALARCVYADADLYLLDDPLSAVDASVSKQLRTRLLDKSAGGLLADKAIVIVTHQLSVLPLADKVIVMDGGRILHNAPFQELQAHGVSFEGVFDESSLMAMGSSVDPTRGDRSVSSFRSTSTAVDSLSKGMDGATTTVEDRRVGKVSPSVYKEYVMQAGGVFTVLAVSSAFIASQAARSGADVWLAFWSTGRWANQNDTFYALIYLSLGVAAISFSVCRAAVYSQQSTKASLRCHEMLLRRILSATLLFFEVTPSGRILNRFSSDLEGLDMLLPTYAQDFLQIVFSSLGAVVAIGIFLPWFLLALVPVILVFWVTQKVYLLSSRELKRIEGISRSPVYSTIVESAAGCVSVRAFAAELSFAGKLAERVDANLRSYLMFQCSGRWLGVRLDFLSAVIVFVTSLTAVILSHTLDPGAAGVALTQSLTLTGVLQWATRQSAECENVFTSVERVIAMATETPMEAPAIIEDSVDASKWPSRGVLEFDCVSLKYRPELDVSLKDVSFKTRPQEKIGMYDGSRSYPTG
jgi:ATP-binding cassette, subfamily C (CFTR/MRP), member 1